MRIDKFLKVSRILKRRTLAQESVSSGRIKINGKVVKPAHQVKEGDLVELGFSSGTITIKILMIKETVKKEEKKAKKKRKKLFGNGTTLHNELNPDITIQELDPLKPKEEGVLVNVPVHLIIDGKEFEKGYYKVFAEQDEENGKKYVSFYQSQFFKGKVEVIETQEDFGEENLDFAKVLPYNDSFVKLIFGSIDFNAYVFIPFAE